MAGFSPTDLVAELLTQFEQRWVPPEALESLADKAGVSSLQDRIAFFRELLQLTRMVPVVVFDDEEQRQNMIDAAQQALDAAIEREG